MNSKPCESAYLASTEGPQLHAAGMLDRTSGVTHFYLVRGKCTQSVVGELHKQLTKAGKIHDAPPAPGWSCAVLVIGAVAGLFSALFA